MSRYRVGCTGWGYEDWRGGFYPPGTPPGEFLERYGRVFDLTEVDSTYYRAPSPMQVARWAEVTSPGFIFTLKLPGAITHDRKLLHVEDELERFLHSLAPLKRAGKLGPLVVQLPATFTRDKHEARLRDFLAIAPMAYRWAVELRHESWWTADTYRMLEERNASLVWSVNQYAETPPEVTSDFLYARVIGDRQLTRFDRVQRDLTDGLRALREKFEAEGLSAEEVLVLVNNHYMGFAPATVLRMQEILGLPRADISGAARSGSQASLGDF